MLIKTLSNTNITKDSNNEIKGKVIRKGSLARQILRKGGEDVRIFDLKQDRENPDRTVFIFRDDEKFQSVFSEVLEENRKQKEAASKDSEALRSELEELKKKFAELSKMNDAKE